MVFNFWHFLPKLGHLVLKQKKIPVFKKNRILYLTHMQCIALRTLVTNWVFEVSNSIHSIGNLVVLNQTQHVHSCKKVCSRKCPKVAKIAKAKITRFLKKLFDSHEDFGDKLGLGRSRSWRCQDNQSGPKREGIIQLLLIFCTDQVIQF